MDKIWIARAYHSASLRKPALRQNRSSLCRYAVGSTWRFQHSLRRQVGHRLRGLLSDSTWLLLPFMLHSNAVQWCIVRMCAVSCEAVPSVRVQAKLKSIGTARRVAVAID